MQRPSFPIPFSARHNLRVAGIACFLAAPAAHATMLATCHVSDSPLVCRLRSVLSLMEMVALVLGALLLLVILLTIRAFRRKPRKLKPDDLTTEAR